MEYLKLLEEELARESVPLGEFDPVFAFSIHKAGSSLMHGMIRAVCKREAIPALNLPTTLFHLGVPDGAWIQDPRLAGYFPPGRVYFGFRELPSAVLEPEVSLGTRKSVLLVRDPRDALVSQFFSLGGRHFSHALSKARPEMHLNKARKTAHLEIDEYVLHVAQGYKDKLAQYTRILDLPGLRLRRYEDVYYDKAGFLEGIFRHFGIPVAGETIEAVARANDVRPAAEDLSKHIRKGTPGDHREKLRPETIEQLNVIFRETGRRFGYDL